MNGGDEGENSVRSAVPADLFLCGGAGSFLQSSLWGNFKSRFGWEARPFSLEWERGGSRPLLVLCRKLSPGFSFAYVPWGPEAPGPAIPFPGNRCAPGGGALLAGIAESVKPFLPRGAAFIRFDPPWYRAESPFAVGAPLVRAVSDIQPPCTVLVSLERDEAAMLAAMKPKCRYNILLAERKGVTVRRADAGGLDVFYALLCETARRDGIAVHGEGYYRSLFDSAGGEPGADLRLYIACHGGDDLAAAVVLFRGPSAVYLYGASSNNKRNLMAPYLLQWRAMKDARISGCAVYDLFGIPPSGDPSHPMAGLYRFKTGFGGVVVHRPGSWDYAYRPILYRAYRTAEAARKGIMNARRKKPRREKDRPPPHRA
ncbi:MAG: peptidoglycan bridge formation glycyltransferase FemA/FemB family protein [Treponema sp.]|jgi:lipid II:glycine glycyltransferase (peptidoglycan interpeptide bridge formation enzyme)|nr:peptidoglycan bridge formation glycyltransferase FemA/FemB family protein [Treponema sp.]